MYLKVVLRYVVTRNGFRCVRCALISRENKCQNIIVLYAAQSREKQSSEALSHKCKREM